MNNSGEGRENKLWKKVVNKNYLVVEQNSFINGKTTSTIQDEWTRWIMFKNLSLRLKAISSKYHSKVQKKFFDRREPSILIQNVNCVIVSYLKITKFVSTSVGTCFSHSQLVSRYKIHF